MSLCTGDHVIEQDNTLAIGWTCHCVYIATEDDHVILFTAYVMWTCFRVKMSLCMCAYVAKLSCSFTYLSISTLVQPHYIIYTAIATSSQ